jgi:HPt (histidine-containing phosphotransfer) domain-containing protein
MTAHAMAGDEQKSIEAGMNGHVTKPIDPDQLFSTLQKWIKPVAERSAAHVPLAADLPSESDPEILAENELPEYLPGFDLADGLTRLQGNKKLYRKLLLNFAANYKTSANEIRQTIDDRDFEQAHSLVHNLRGLAGNLAAAELQAGATNLEKLVKGAHQNPPPPRELNLKLSELENVLNQALESAQSVGAPAAETSQKPFAETLADIPAELSRDIARRIRDAADMGDVTTLNTVADEIKIQSDACTPISDRIVQMAENFEFDGILQLADDLDPK